MIELKLDDREEYERLKPYARYASDTTMVLQLPDNYKDQVDGVREVKADAPILDFQDGKFAINGADPAMKMFLSDDYNVCKGAYSLRRLSEIAYLVENGLLSPSIVIKNEFKPLASHATVRDLHCLKVRAGKGEKYVKWSDIEGIEVDALCDGAQTSSKPVFTAEATVLDRIFMVDGRAKPYMDVFYQVKVDGELYEIEHKFYYNKNLTRPKIPLDRVSEPNTNQNIFVKRDGEGVRFVGMAPDGCKQTEEVIFNPSKEAKKLVKMPVAQWRLIYAEYRLREELL